MDYQRQTPKPAAKKMGGILWLFMGLFLGLIIGGIFYLKNHTPAPTVIQAPVAETTAPIATTPSPVTQAQAKQQLQTQFDFYQVLPSQKVTGPTGDEETTNMSPPPTPAPPPSVTTTPQSPQESTSNAVMATPPATNLSPAPAQEQTMPETSPPPATAATSVLPAKPLHPAKPKKLPSVNITVPKKAIPATTAPLSGAYRIQIGVFKDFANADQLKAQLILAGLNAHISLMQKNGAALQQVWIGPYPSMRAVKIAQQQLPTALQPGKLL